MPMLQTRRRFLTGLSLAGAAGLLKARPVRAARDSLETTIVRFARLPGLCIAP